MEDFERRNEGMRETGKGDEGQQTVDGSSDEGEGTQRGETRRLEDRFDQLCSFV